MRKIAIIDLGSNSVRMNIMRINELGGYSVFDSAKEMVRLSEGLEQDGMLKPVPIDRTLKALKYFKRLIEVTEVQEVYAVATAAVRLAKNGDFFIKRARDEVGLNFRILSGKEEAYYDYLGVVNSIQINDCAIIDIGGASTEIVWVKNRMIKESVSMPFGSVILTEMFGEIKSKRERLHMASQYVKSEMEKVEWLGSLKGLRVIGLGGTIRTIGKIDRGFNSYPIKNMHNYRMTRGEVERVISLVFKKEEKDLKFIDGINNRRADVISLGMVPLKTLLAYTGSKGISVSGYGLRNGFFYEKFFDEAKIPVLVGDVLTHSCENTMKRFNVNPGHAAQVRFLALKLFDSFKAIHSFDENDRKVLEISALLHDIGMHIEYYDHNLHGMYLLIYGKINGLTNHEHLKVAFLVGNHRETSIKEKMKEYNSLFSNKDIKKILKLSIFLKMAEQMDRAVNSNIKDFTLEWNGRNALIEVYADENPILEIEAALRFKRLFYKSFNCSYDIQYGGPVKQL